MIWQSVPLMTLIDVVILGAALIALRLFLREREHLAEAWARIGSLAILGGVGLVGLFFATDLFLMWGMPLIAPRPRAMALMEDLHLEYKWIVMVIAVPAVAVGLGITTRGLVSLVRQLREREEETRALTETISEERSLLAHRVEERTADLSAANAELAQTARAKDEFLAGMSHELRTPLNAILTLTESLQEEVYGTLDQRQRKPLETVAESGHHLLALINDILDLAKVEAGQLEIERGRVTVELVVQAGLRFIKESAQNKRIKISSNLDPLVTTLDTDERRLKQILVNLLSNAVKFTPDEGEIGVEVRGDVEREVVQFAVWDTGIGIKAEQMDRLFKPFIQVDAGLNRQYEGTGLGLSLVARMTEIMGGSVALESEGEGKGSRFTVTLPWTKPDMAEESTPGAHRRATPPGVVRNVLVVEDSPTMADQLGRYLTELGADTTVLSGGTGVVTAAADLQPDVILLDLILPDKSGWVVLSDLKADPRTRDIPVVVVSVVDERPRGLALGAVDYLVKPISRDQLQATLAGLKFDGEPKKAMVVVTDGTLATAPLVLLAEDNEANIISISDYLRAKDYRVRVARNGDEAVKLACEQMPNLILMDIQMPGTDGLEATRRIRRRPELSAVPIVALTALAMPGDRERCLAAGVDDYVTKPVNLRALVATIEGLLTDEGGGGRTA